MKVLGGKPFYNIISKDIKPYLYNLSIGEVFYFIIKF